MPKSPHAVEVKVDELRKQMLPADLPTLSTTDRPTTPEVERIISTVLAASLHRGHGQLWEWDWDRSSSEKEILSRPDVLEALTDAIRASEEWKRSL